MPASTRKSSADTPDLLEIALDKPEYRSGDTMNVAVTARTAGQAHAQRVHRPAGRHARRRTCKAGARAVPLPVGKDWGSGAYLVATLRRPLDVAGAAHARPRHRRAVVLASTARRTRSRVDLELPATLRPNRTLRVPVKLAGLAAGEEARVVVAAVDVGILNLTNYKPPAPDDYYLGQRQLTADIRDLYGQLIDGMQGARGQIRSGGDDAAPNCSGSPPTQPPLALYSGIVTRRPPTAARRCASTSPTSPAPCG